MIKIDRPKIEDAPPRCAYFFDLTTEDNLLEALQNNKKNTVDLICFIPLAWENFKYTEDKWSIKSVFIHMIDTERFYAYRAFCSSRQVDVDLDFSKDRDIYAKNDNSANRTLKDINDEFILTREATITLFSNMTNDMLDFKGFLNKPLYTARSLGWMAVGHNIHHHNILKEKYLAG